jgi:hypothetical protein
MKTIRAECDGYNWQSGMVNRCGARLHNGQTYRVLYLSSNGFDFDAACCENELINAPAARTDLRTPISGRKETL